MESDFAGIAPGGVTALIVSQLAGMLAAVILRRWLWGDGMTAVGVRRDKAALSSGCKSHPATAPAGSNRSSYGGNEVAEAFGVRVTNW